VAVPLGPGLAFGRASAPTVLTWTVGQFGRREVTYMPAKKKAAKKGKKSAKKK